VRRAVPTLIRSLRAEDGLTSAEHAVLMSLILATCLFAAYIVSSGVQEPTGKVSAVTERIGKSPATSSTAKQVTPSRGVPPDEVVEVQSYPEKDSSLWGWALLSLVVSVSLVAIAVGWWRLSIFLSHLRTRKKVRESMTDEEVEAAVNKIANGSEAGPVVLFKSQDTRLIGRNMLDFTLGGLLDQQQPVSKPSSPEGPTDGEVVPTVIVFDAPFTSPATPPKAPPAAPGSP
jgi:hypothetical protein